MSTTDPASDDVHVEVDADAHLAVIELRRPPANYFDVPLLRALAARLEELDEDPLVRAIVLVSEGRHFCAGADFSPGGSFGEDRPEVARQLYQLGSRIFDIRTPLVAAVQGAAVGGGLGLACAADFRVADAESRFTANFARLGIHHGFGLTVTLPRIVGEQRATSLLCRGGTVRGEEAAAIGLVDRLAPVGQVRSVAMDFAGEIAAAAPLAVRSIRDTVRSDLAARVREALARELAEQTRLWSTEDSVEGLHATLERRPPVFVGR